MAFSISKAMYGPSRSKFNNVRIATYNARLIEISIFASLLLFVLKPIFRTIFCADADVAANAAAITIVDIVAAATRRLLFKLDMIFPLCDLFCIFRWRPS